MKVKNIAITILFFIMILPFAYGEDVFVGKIEENGFGKFKLMPADGVSRLIYVGRRETAYKPSNWVQEFGDTVKVTCIRRPGRNAIKLVATLIELVERNPNAPKFESPMECEIIEVGRKWVNVKSISSGMTIKMEKARGVQYDPVGWMPYAGEKVVLHFSKVKARFGNKYVYLISKFEKK